MRLQKRLEILPHYWAVFGELLPYRAKVCCGVLSLVVLSACTSLPPMKSRKPEMPQNYEQAQSYMAGREQQLAILDYELNEQTRACYKRFFVASCLDDVRAEKAELRRAHAEAADRAMDLIRMHDYSDRQKDSRGKSGAEVHQ